MGSSIADLTAGIGLPVAAVALVLSWRQAQPAREQAEDTAAQAKRTADANRAQSMLVIDQAFAESSAMRDNMNVPTWRPISPLDGIHLARYVAVSERLGMLVKAGLLDLPTVESPYPPEIRKLLDHPAAREELQDEREAYGLVIELWQELFERQSDDVRRLPDPGTLFARVPVGQP